MLATSFLPRPNPARTLSAAALIGLAAATALGDAPWGPVALKGEATPIAGTTFQFHSFSPSIGAAGHAAFTSIIAGAGVTSENQEILCVGTRDSLSVMARKGFPAPGTPAGVKFKNAFISTPPVVNAAGHAFAFLELVGPGVSDFNEAALFYHDGATTTLVARQRAQAIGVEPGVTYGDFLGVPLFMNDAGQIAFASLLNDTPHNRAIYHGVPGSISLLARRGDPAPDVAPGATIVFFDTTTMALSNSGELAHIAFVLVPGVGTVSVLRAGIPGSVQKIAMEGDLLAGLTLGAFGGYTMPQLNAAGDYAFAAPLAAPVGEPDLAIESDSAIFAGRPGAWTVIAREGDPAPGTTPDTRFGEFEITLNTTTDQWDPRGLDMAGSGDVVFRTRLVGPDVTPANDTAIYSNASGSLAVVAREGDQAPGTPAGCVFADFNDWESGIHPTANPTINAGGRIVFEAGLVGPGIEPGLNDRGIWATDSSGQLTLVVAHGSTFDIDPSPAAHDLRSVAAFGMFGGVRGGGGRAAPSNDLGQTVVGLGFDDGTGGIFILTETPVPGDVNGDTVTDILDFLEFINAFGECANQPAPCGTPDADFNGDTSVDVLDFLEFLDVFGQMTE